MLRTSLIALLLYATTLSAFAQAETAPARQWLKIAHLPAGTPLLIRERNRLAPTVCALLWIDHTAVACATQDPMRDSERIVLPAATVLSIEKLHPSRDNSDMVPHLAGPLIGAGIGALIGTLACRNNGARPAFACASIGAAFGGGFAASLPSPPSYQPRPQWSMQIPLGHTPWR